MTIAIVNSISLDDLLRWVGVAVMLAAAGLVLWALLWDRSKGRPRCRRCWYDLAGVSVSDGVTTCPECGREHTKPRHMKRTRRRPIIALAGIALVVAGYMTLNVPRVKHEGWVGFVPTPVLLVAAPWSQPDPDLGHVVCMLRDQVNARSVYNVGAKHKSADLITLALVERGRSDVLSRVIIDHWLLPEHAAGELREMFDSSAGVVVLSEMLRGSVDWHHFEGAFKRYVTGMLSIEEDAGAGSNPHGWCIRTPPERPGSVYIFEDVFGLGQLYFRVINEAGPEQHSWAFPLRSGSERPARLGAPLPCRVLVEGYYVMFTSHALDRAEVRDLLWEIEITGVGEPAQIIDSELSATKEPDQ